MQNWEKTNNGTSAYAGTKVPAFRLHQPRGIIQELTFWTRWVIRILILITQQLMEILRFFMEI